MEIKIPAQLKNKSFGFCKVEKQKKKPFEFQWQNKPYNYDDVKIIEYLNKDGNYGVIAGYGRLRILDIDNLNLIPLFDKLFGDTFSVKTPSGGRHYYFLSDYNKNHVLKDGGGELRCDKMQCVGPNSEVNRNDK